MSSLELLKTLIRINTTNPPGNEIKAIAFAKSYLSRHGIQSEVLESAPGRGNLIARLKGSGEKGTLLLLAHLDVVTAEPKEWTFPPFEPTESEGFLYGRGAIDMKGMAALMIHTFVQLKVANFPLAGDVLLVLVADEEAGGKYGAQFLVEKHWEKVKADMVFGEGSIGLKKNGLHLYPIQVAEKGVAWLKLTAKGTSGHGSMPIPDNATATLVKALDRVVSRKQPIEKTAIVEALLDRLAANFSFPQSFIMRHLFDFPIRQLAPILAGSKIEGDKILNAMVRNTVVPTVLKAGSKTNVIPSTAMAWIDCRILPGKTPEEFRQRVEGWIQDPRVQVELVTESNPNESNFRTPYFQALEEAIRSQDPEAIVVPFISPGATDNRFFREKGALSYGIIPLLVTMKDIEGLHGKNERIPLRELKRGDAILWNFVTKAQGE